MFEALVGCLLAWVLSSSGWFVPQSPDAKGVIPAVSRWNLVKGNLGKIQIGVGTLGFRRKSLVLSWMVALPESPVMPAADTPDSDRAVLKWLEGEQHREDVDKGKGLLWAEYELAPQTRSLTFSGLSFSTGNRYEGRCRMVGDDLEVTMREFVRVPVFGTWSESADVVHLLFKPVK